MFVLNSLSKSVGCPSATGKTLLAEKERPTRHRIDQVFPITIGIGTICQNRERAVAVSDRMITDEALSIEFEHGRPKIIQISRNCVAMTAGSSTSFQEILEPVIRRFEREEPPISDIVEEVARSYNEVRKKKINDLYFRPRGLSIQTFYEDQTGLHEGLVRFLDDVVSEFEFPDLETPADLQILVVGVDERAHVYLVDNPGNFTPHDELGWACIGTGSQQAENSLISNRFNPSLDFNKGLYLTYEAKKRAERSPGVGVDTDIASIDRNGVRFLSNESRTALDSLFREKETKIRPIEEEMDNKISRLTLW